MFEPTELLDGHHYTTFVPEVKALKRQGRYGDAEALLLRIIEVVERSSAFPPPWYYEQVAIVRRKQGRFAEEIEILEHYERLTGDRTAGRPSRLRERLAKIRGTAAPSPDDQPPAWKEPTSTALTKPIQATDGGDIDASAKAGKRLALRHTGRLMNAVRRRALDKIQQIYMDNEADRVQSTSGGRSRRRSGTRT